MFQDIAPHVLHNEFRTQKPKETDYVIIVRGEEQLLYLNDGEVGLPTVGEVVSFTGETSDNLEKEMIYLFSIDETAFFWMRNELLREDTGRYSYIGKFHVRGKEPEEIAYASAVGFHVAAWYEQNRFCGKCGAKFGYSKKERAVVCEHCGNTQYPRINPAMIVAIIHKDKILLSKYSAGYYRKHALIAGYSEPGETMEETVHREVMEETGLKVKNIRYFGSQPWPFTGSMLMGFFAELDGSDEIHIDEEELSSAEWYDREHLPKEDNQLSLTWTMIEYFRNHPEFDKL